MKLDINLAKESPSDDLPDQTKNKMFPALNKIRRANIHDMSETFGRVNDQIVVFDHLELTEFLSSSRFIEDTLIDCLRSTLRRTRQYIWDRVIDEF